MKKFFTVFFQVLAVLMAIAAVVYAVYALCGRKMRRTRMVFRSDFDPDEPIGAAEPAPEAPAQPQGACNGDAVCAVDMCMPY